jgi:hypothetical protein
MRFVGKQILSRRICRVTMQVVRFFRQLCPYTALLMLVVSSATADAATQPEPRLATGVYWQDNRCADIQLPGSSDILPGSTDILLWCVESVHGNGSKRGAIRGVVRDRRRDRMDPDELSAFALPAR